MENSQTDLWLNNVIQLYWEADVICNFLYMALLSGEWCLANVLFVDCRGNMHISLLSYCVLENSEPDVPEHWGWNFKSFLRKTFWKFDPNFWLGWKERWDNLRTTLKAKPGTKIRTRVKRSWHKVKEERDTCKDKIWVNKCPTEEETLFFYHWEQGNSTSLPLNPLQYKTEELDHTASCQVTKISFILMHEVCEFYPPSKSHIPKSCFHVCVIVSIIFSCW